ncbi:hypothetical protein B0H11DRAFT_2294578 [Mycena galericulata]|nr:hypothetical protein B0H11DRAFT_2294578 [Mycena galericulata]
MANSSPHMGPLTHTRDIRPIVNLAEVDYPKAKYWQKTLWTQQIDRDRGLTSISDRPVTSKNSLLFITTEDGRSPTPDRMSQARRCTSALYFELKKENLLPGTWTQAMHSVKNRFRAVVESEIPELRLCDNHWKADKLASITFSSWCGTHRKDTRIKSEQVSDDDIVNESSNDSDNENDTPPDEEGSKRRRPPGSSHRDRKEKKAKVSNNESSSGKASKDMAKGRKRSKNPLLGLTPDVVMTQANSGSPPTGQDGPEAGDATGPAPATTAPAPVANSTVTAPLDPFPANPPAVASLIPSLTSASIPSSTLSALPSPVEIHLLPLPLASSTILAQPLASVSFPAPPPLASVSLPAPPPASTSSIVLNSAPVAVPPPNPAPSGTKTKPRAWNPSSASTSMKGLCAYDFHKRNPSADRTMFEDYFKVLPKEEKKVWRDKETNAKAAKAQHRWESAGEGEMEAAEEAGMRVGAARRSSMGRDKRGGRGGVRRGSGGRVCGSTWAERSSVGRDGAAQGGAGRGGAVRGAVGWPSGTQLYHDGLHRYSTILFNDNTKSAPTLST